MFLLLDVADVADEVSPEGPVHEAEGGGHHKDEPRRERLCIYMYIYTYIYIYIYRERER